MGSEGARDDTTPLILRRQVGPPSKMLYVTATGQFWAHLLTKLFICLVLVSSTFPTIQKLSHIEPVAFGVLLGLPIGTKPRGYDTASPACWKHSPATSSAPLLRRERRNGHNVRGGRVREIQRPSRLAGRRQHGVFGAAPRKSLRYGD
jgi:hypothetical protein